MTSKYDAGEVGAMLDRDRQGNVCVQRQARNGVLETVTADGLIRQRVSSGQGDVREPVWSPFPRF